MRIYLIPAKHAIKKPYSFSGGYCALVGKKDYGIQNIDYVLNIFGGRIPDVPDNLSEIRQESGY